MLALIVFFPWLAVFAMFALRPDAMRTARVIAMGFAAIEMALVAVVFRKVPKDLGFQFDLAPSIAWSWQFRGDGASLAFAFLAALTAFVVVARPLGKNRRAAAALTFVTLSLAMGALFATDILTFFLFHELMALPLALLLVGWGGTFGFYSAKRYLASTLFSSAMLLAAAAYLHFRVSAGVASSEILEGKEPWFLMVAFVLGFGTRLAIFPLHPWLVRVQIELPPGSVPLLNSLLIPVSFLGFLRHAWPRLEGIADEIRGPLLFLAALSALFAALSALGQKRPRRQLALLVMASVSAAFCSVLSGSIEGEAAAVVLILGQGLGFLALSVVWDSAEPVYPPLAIDVPNESVHKRRDLLQWVVVMAALGFPGTLVFVGEFSLVYALIDSNPLVALALVATFLLTAWGLIEAIRNPASRTRLASAASPAGGVALDGAERIALVLVLVLNLAAGLFPFWLLQRIELGLEAWVPAVAKGMGG